MAAKKKKAAAKAPPKAKAPRKGRKELSSAAGPGHNSATFASDLDEVIQALFEMNELMEKDMAGYRGEFAAAYTAASTKLGVRQNVIKDEFNRAKRRKKEIEKEKAYDPIEREQRQMIRAATTDLSLKGTPMGDLFAGIMAGGADSNAGEDEGGHPEDKGTAPEEE